MRVAAIQMCSGTDVVANIAAASDLIRAAAADGARFIATPEMTHLLQKDATELRRGVKPMAEDEGVTAFAALAVELDIHLLIGSLAILRDDGKIANRSLLFTPDGKLSAQYDKIHLFEAAISKSENYRESDTYTAGERSVIAPVGDLNLGLSICYDVRFPSLYAGYAKAEVDLIAVPAAFTVATGKAHWETLLRARAIETGAYVIAPAQGGHHADGRRTWGRSLIVDPWGEVLEKLDHDDPGFILADIDRAAVTKARARIPAWRGAPS
ncbi:carbon-nitrogen hydrolase family protein [Litorimonas sp. WD9-15]|uniref:carbon-nitrogen hydrolase family protein n=1 Tax=Litorimonas sp. WD9-15 TaxID=3418716 RepID=UPI003D05A5DC